MQEDTDYTYVKVRYLSNFESIHSVFYGVDVLLNISSTKILLRLTLVHFSHKFSFIYDMIPYSMYVPQVIGDS